MKIRLLLISLLVMLAAVGVSAQEEITDQARFYTTWDDAYLYLAVKVDSPDIQATHTKPNEPVGDDDSVTVYVDTKGKRPEKIDSSCASFTVSPAGGAQFCLGTNEGVLEPKTVWTFKYGISLQGTISNSDDIDMGYIVELAIPWEIMNASRPAIGDMIGINVVVRRKNSGFVSVAPNVKAEADILSPQKWSRLVFAPYSFAVATTDLEKIVSARYVVRAPLINGVINDKEWHNNTSFAINLPVPEGVVYEAKFPAQKTILADYVFHSRSGEQPSVTLVNYPIKNIGPWSSSDRTQHHKDELSDMVAAGIDVVLVEFSGDSRSSTGLFYLISAIDELKAEGKPYPLVGMRLSGQDVDGGNTPPQIYTVIKDFFARVPVEYRASAQANAPWKGQAGCVLSADSLTPEAYEYCTVQFFRGFRCPLVIVNAATGPARMATVAAAYEAALSGTPDMRVGGEAYQKSWTAAIEAKAGWVLCNSWNRLSEPGSICATREYGRKYIDATAVNARRFKGSQDFDAQYVRYSVPALIPAQAFATAEIEIRNAGNSAWRVSEGYALAYRWYRNGRYFGESKIRRPLGRDVKPGESVTVTIGIATVDSSGKPMPDGSYEARLELIRMSDNKWFSLLGDQPLMVPVTVGPAPEWVGSWISGSAPSMMAAGQTYKRVFRVRNDGTQTWVKGITKITGNLFKVSTEPSAASEAVPTREISAALAKDCKPGEIAEFVLEINLTGADKKPIPVWNPDEPWVYQLVFDIHNGKQWLSEHGVFSHRQRVAVYESDWGPRVVDCSIPSKLQAGQLVETRLVVRNTGTQMWDRKRVSVGYHWYHLDGSEMTWGGPAVPVPVNVGPGLPVVMNARVTAPQYDGQYVLVWDVIVDDVWQSTQPLRRGGDILPVFVEVTGGRLTLVDLANLYDTSAVSPDSDRTTGDFDGKGNSFPAEIIPPDASVSGEAKRVFPTGYQLVRDKQPEGRISFYYPEKTPGAMNAVSCDGQSVEVEKRTYRTLHILGASSDGEASGDITLTYSDSVQPFTLKMSDWTSEPANGEQIAFAASHRHTHGGDDPTKPARLFHYTIPLDSGKALSSVTLPKNGKMKVVAITLER